MRGAHSRPTAPGARLHHFRLRPGPVTFGVYSVSVSVQFPSRLRSVSAPFPLSVRVQLGPVYSRCQFRFSFRPGYVQFLFRLRPVSVSAMIRFG